MKNFIIFFIVKISILFNRAVLDFDAFNQKPLLLSHKNSSKTDEIGNMLQEIDSDYIQYCYGSEAEKLHVILEKHPHTGLGLTLVDGAVNGVKGVYVKSVSEDGDGKKKVCNLICKI